MTAFEQQMKFRVECFNKCNLLPFDTIEQNARFNGTYYALTLDTGNNLSLTLDTDGKTARVFYRKDGWTEIDSFTAESGQKRWTDLDIDRALNGPFD